jgi:hypothetical protein
MDTYSIWLDSAMVYMKKGIEKELCYQGVDCEDDSKFADMPTATIEDNLFYSSIKLMPSTFLKKQRRI